MTPRYLVNVQVSHEGLALVKTILRRPLRGEPALAATIAKLSLTYDDFIDGATGPTHTSAPDALGFVYKISITSL